MPWNPDTPARPGYYWLRSPLGGRVEAVEVTIEEGTGAVLVQFIGDAETYFASDEDGEWSGPLAPAP
jgi:hypothetical protein